jgi:cytochrome P450
MIPNLWQVPAVVMHDHDSNRKLIFQNRTISRDPKHYPDPDEFRPERFLKGGSDDQPMDPRLYCFGVGRRYVL